MSEGHMDKTAMHRKMMEADRNSYDERGNLYGEATPTNTINHPSEMIQERLRKAEPLPDMGDGVECVPEPDPSAEQKSVPTHCRSCNVMLWQRSIGCYECGRRHRQRSERKGIATGDVAPTAEHPSVVGPQEQPEPEFTPLSEHKPEPYQLVMIEFDGRCSSREIVYLDAFGAWTFADGSTRADLSAWTYRPATPADLVDYEGEWVESGGKCWVAAKWIPFEEHMPSLEKLVHFSYDGIAESEQTGAHSPVNYFQMGGGYWCYAEDFHRLPESERGGCGVSELIDGSWHFLETSLLSHEPGHPQPIQGQLIEIAIETENGATLIRKEPLRYSRDSVPAHADYWRPCEASK